LPRKGKGGGGKKEGFLRQYAVTAGRGKKEKGKGQGRNSSFLLEKEKKGSVCTAGSALKGKEKKEGGKILHNQPPIA